MRIAFCGAGGTGKTTALNVLSSLPQFRDHAVLKSASRTIFEQRGMSEHTEKHMTVEERWGFQGAIFNLKLYRDSEWRNFLADRTVLDHYAYCLVQAAGAMTRDATLHTEGSEDKRKQAYRECRRHGGCHQHGPKSGSWKRRTQQRRGQCAEGEQQPIEVRVHGQHQAHGQT